MASLVPEPIGEVRGMGRIAQQHDVAVPPAAVAHGVEVQPLGVIGQDPVAVQFAGEDRADLSDRFSSGHPRSENDPLALLSKRAARPRRPRCISTMKVIPHPSTGSRGSA